MADLYWANTKKDRRYLRDKFIQDDSQSEEIHLQRQIKENEQKNERPHGPWIFIQNQTAFPNIWVRRALWIISTHLNLRRKIIYLTRVTT